MKGYLPIISHKRKYIYYYVPKVACTSIRKILAEADGIKWYPNWTTDSNGKVIETPFKRMKLSESKKFDYYKFGFVRNPWDRLVSCYVDKIVNSRTKPLSRFIKNGEYRNFVRRYKRSFKDFSFQDFVDFVCDLNDNESDGHFRSQHTFFPKKIDFVGKFENLTQDLNKALSQLEITSYTLTKQQVSNAGDYLSYYDQALWEKVAKRFEQDIKAFGYEGEIEW